MEFKNKQELIQYIDKIPNNKRIYFSLESEAVDGSKVNCGIDILKIYEDKEHIEIMFEEL